ncbi:YwgA family protein [Alkalibacillus haloalkaliphilus]|uniref:YwgA family protein n=1 Tax=Alkalibacillus haloalkaliphilus TaxID=94136 RepID=UPI00293572DD|nr:YwgA family protein [Alkalibacillus haloalkaliphilus]MDV2583001.1 YwgA family protein [Alkalibacillus haloalkaliphilus]
MLEDHARLMAFFEQAQEVVGRKRLQKMVYILKKCGFDFSERYSFHFYGPYSEELSTRIEELCNLGFLDEAKEKEKGYYQYRYHLTDRGAGFLSESGVTTPSMDAVIQKMDEQSSKFLELVSTMLYFDNSSKEEIEDKVRTVKSQQNYTEADFEEAWRFINDMKH